MSNLSWPLITFGNNIESNPSKKRYHIEPRLGYSFYTLRTAESPAVYINGISNILGIGQSYAFQNYQVFFDVESWISRMTEPSVNPSPNPKLWTAITWSVTLGLNHYLKGQKTYITILSGYQSWDINQPNHNWSKTSFPLMGLGGGIPFNNKWNLQMRVLFSTEETNSQLISWTIGRIF
ncbi:MAG: hypothetical protein NZ480_05340 [Bdellovibrionaceae bacterium]|nr:hypothetical protein [Pseudobdellovibrionaceae bacterium]MDW8190397.1 hypothetical protein [Pseudobdellovibrionaceae bacterium]